MRKIITLLSTVPGTYKSSVTVTNPTIVTAIISIIPLWMGADSKWLTLIEKSEKLFFFSLLFVFNEHLKPSRLPHQDALVFSCCAVLMYLECSLFVL